MTDAKVQLYCGNCTWELEIGAACKNECPDCGDTLRYREAPCSEILGTYEKAGRVMASEVFGIVSFDDKVQADN